MATWTKTCAPIPGGFIFHPHPCDFAPSESYATERLAHGAEVARPRQDSRGHDQLLAHASSAGEGPAGLVGVYGFQRKPRKTQGVDRLQGEGVYMFAGFGWWIFVVNGKTKIKPGKLAMRELCCS